VDEERRPVSVRLVVAALLSALAAVDSGLIAISAAQVKSSTDTTLVVSLINRPVGRETFSETKDGEGTVYTGALDLTERGGRLQVSSALRLASDLTPTSFEVKGQSYRFVNVDAVVRVDGGMATVTNRGTTTTFEAPRRFFTAESYSPLSARALLIRYWERHGRPAVIPVLPGPRDVRITYRGTDPVIVRGIPVTFRRFDVEGVVWGRETVWLDEEDRLAAIVSRIHILPLEAVREDLVGQLPTLQSHSNADRVADLAQHLKDIPAIAERSFVLSGARLIDGTGRAPIDDAVIVVRDRRIESAGPRAAVKIPPGLRILDVKGATIAPGLWDMHAHAAQIEWLPAYLAAGVTTFRDMGGEQPFLVAIRDAVASGKGLGPRVLLAGLVDGDAAGAFGAVVAATPEQGRIVVDRYHAAGFNQMKLYSLLQPDVVSAIIARAHELGMTVTGHVPSSLGLRRAVEAGMDQIAHMPVNGDPEAADTKALIGFLASKKTVFDPTMPWNEILGRAPQVTLESLEPGFAHAPPAMLANYQSVANNTDPETARRRVAVSGRMMKALFDAGVPIVAGTDGGLPGFSLLRSIEMYVEAGLTPMQAIQSATSVAAQSMGLLKDSGTIEAGKRADLIVLNADPLADIRNIRKQRWVIAHGRVMEPAGLWRAAGFQ
jgi:imidazolonepropionase-like amidohydrolase